MTPLEKMEKEAAEEREKLKQALYKAMEWKIADEVADQIIFAAVAMVAYQLELARRKNDV